MPAAQKSATAGTTPGGASPARFAVSKFDPAAYITIYEEEGPNRRLRLFDSSTQSTP